MRGTPPRSSPYRPRHPVSVTVRSYLSPSAQDAAPGVCQWLALRPGATVSAARQPPPCAMTGSYLCTDGVGFDGLPQSGFRSPGLTANALACGDLLLES